MQAERTDTNEAQRLSVLHSYHILDTAAESDFDDITALASAVCQTPVSLITFIDGTRQWFKSRNGFDYTETPVELSFCASTIASADGTMIVENAATDDRFRNNPFVTGKDHVGFYAGVSLTTEDGYALGSLCVIDNHPRQLTALQLQSLKTLARSVMYKLELRKRIGELEESEQRFRTMAESTHIMIAMADESSNAIYFNKAWLSFTGRSNEDLLAYGWADLLHPDDTEAYISTYREAFAVKAAFIAEVRILTKDGTYRWLLSDVSPRFLPSGAFTGYISSCIDITQQKELQARKDEFISVASHELRTPVAGLKSCLYLLEWLKDNPDADTLSEVVEQTSFGISRLSRLTDNLLNAARFQHGQIVLTPAVFNVAQMLHRCIAELQPAPGQDIICQCSPEITVEADELYIGQVILNFLNNARKYAHESKTIRIQAEAEEDGITLSVSDEGRGIAPEALPHLFKRYYRSEPSSRQYSGLGLGLYISAQIIELHGGKIWVTSEAGSGSTFAFSLPAAVSLL